MERSLSQKSVLSKATEDAKAGIQRNSLVRASEPPAVKRIWVLLEPKELLPRRGGENTYIQRAVTVGELTICCSFSKHDITSEDHL